MSRGESGSGLHLHDSAREPGDTELSPTPGASPDADGIARMLVAFVNGQIMARGRAIQPDDDLESVGVDSMGLLKILLFVEAEFGFWMPDADLLAENVSSLRALAAYVARRRSRG